MKNNLKLLPVMFYPYIYMICLAMYVYIYSNIDNSMEMQSNGMVIMFILAIVCNLYSLIVVVVNLIMAIKGKYNAIELVKTNMIIKLVHIPAYMIHFALGMLGLLASVWGIGFILWAVLIDLMTIGLTGMIGISASVCARKEGMLSKKMALLYAISSFIYCVDVVSAIVFFVTLRKGRVATEEVVK